MGRRFPEFCILRAACRVSVKASPSATGDARIASYQAAIDAVATQHYADWPFMVEVLNKWLKMNRDFVRDPIGYVASDSSPSPTSATVDGHSPTMSTVQGSPSHTTTSAAPVGSPPLTQDPSTATDDVPSPLSTDAEAFEYVAGSSSVASPAGTETDGLNDPPSTLNGGRGIPVPIQKISSLSSIRALRFLPSLSSLGVSPLTFRSRPSPSHGWLATPESSTQQTSKSTKSRWLRLFFPASLYRGWWDVLKRSFTFRSG